MHFGQQNCTNCTLGNHCPVEGLFVPLSCPPGYSCNAEGIGTPETLCRVGHICLGGVSTGLRKFERSCEILESVGLLVPCPEGVKYANQSEVGIAIPLATSELPIYFKGVKGVSDKSKIEGKTWKEMKDDDIMEDGYNETKTHKSHEWYKTLSKWQKELLNSLRTAQK